jgi:hypothetical protein
MTLFNLDLMVTWHYEGDSVKVIAVNFLHYSGHNIIEFMSKRIFQAIVDDIKKQQDWDGRGA